MKWRALFLGLGVLLLGAPGLLAQDRAAQGPVLVGRIVDSDNGNPLLGAFVHLQGEMRGVLTDEEGRFRFPGLPHGPLLVAVEQLGYEELVRSILFTADMDPLLLELTPDPILLEGIEVVLDRFQTRRKAYAFSSHVYSREDLVTSPAFNLADLLMRRSPLRLSSCPSVLMSGPCAWVRGRVREITVYLDEVRFWGGMDLLAVVEPHELHLVEVYPSRAQIRVYTEAFVERMGRRPSALIPLGVGG